MIFFKNLFQFMLYLALLVFNVFIYSKAFAANGIPSLGSGGQVLSSQIATTGQNIGSGSGTVFKQKTGDNLELKSIVAGSGISITNQTNEIVIAGSGASGEANTASNVGSGSGQSFKQKTGVDLEFRTIKAGNGITITNGTNEIEVASTTAVVEQAPQAASVAWQFADGTQSATTTSSSFVNFNDSDMTYTNAVKVGSPIAPGTSGDVAIRVASYPAGKYEICFTGPYYAGDVNGTSCRFRMTDGTNIIYANASSIDASNTYDKGDGFCGIVEYTTTKTNLEWAFQGRRAAGTGVCYAASGTADVAIRLSIKPLSSVMAATLAENVKAPGIAKPVIVNATVTSGGSGTVANETDDFINGNESSSVFTFTTNYWASAPQCWAVVTGAYDSRFRETSVSTSSLTVQWYGDNNPPFVLWCMGNKN